jgi:hypothetical protein
LLENENVWLRFVFKFTICNDALPRIIRIQKPLIKSPLIILQIQKSVVVGFRKCDGLTSSAPEKEDCGLAVDINHIPDMSTGNVIAPIECLVNDTLRHTPLFLKSYLHKHYALYEVNSNRLFDIL